MFKNINSLIIFVFIFATSLASPLTQTAAAQSDSSASSYKFAIGRYVMKDRQTSFLGEMFHSLDDLLSHLEGERGVVLMFSSLALALILTAASMNYAAALLAAFAALVILVNKPMLLVALIPVVIFVYRETHPKQDDGKRKLSRSAQELREARERNARKTRERVAACGTK